MYKNIFNIDSWVGKSGISANGMGVYEVAAFSVTSALSFFQ